jgi:hypothetical protein
LQIYRYYELDRVVNAFSDGHLTFLMVCGPPGVGKSRIVLNKLGSAVSWIDGNVSAFGLYLQAYENCDEVIVLDDVDGLYRDRNGVRLLKSLCQSEEVKSLCWQTNAAALEQRGVPHSFETTSRVLIIANQWKSLNPDVAALEDRAHCVQFTPPAREIHRQAATWFKDDEIFAFIADHLHLMEHHSLRTYVLASEQKQAGLDWKLLVLSRCLTGNALEVAKLRTDASFQTEEQRAQAFVQSGAGCRATYYNHAKKLRPAQ